MVKEQLTGAMIDGGAALTAKLDENGLGVTAAFWLFLPELNEWRLHFASPDVGTKGPREVYERVSLAIDQLGANAATPLSIVTVLDDNDDLVRLLKGGIRTGPGLNRIRFSRDVIDGHFIDDALIYRAA